MSLVRSISRYQWLVLIVAWLGWVFDIMDTALFNFAKLSMMTELLGGAAAYKARGASIEGQMQTIFIIGWALGGLVFGVIADRWGRSRTMVFTILLYCAFTGLTAACTSWEQVAAVRFLTAIGIGGEWAAGAALVAEVFSDQLRPVAAAFLQTAAAIGPVFAALINLTPLGSQWRWLFLVGILPALITVLIRTGIKEPERWKEHHDRGPALQPLKDLFGNRKWAKHAVLAMVIGTVGIAGAGNLAFWLPNLVKDASVGLSKEIVQHRTSYATMTMHLGTLCGVFFFPWLAVALGRRIALAIGFLASPVLIWLALNAGATYERLLWMAPVLSFFAIGLSSIFGLYFPELFPTRIRATGAGFAYNTARITQAPLPWLTGRLINQPASSPAHGVTLAALAYLFGLVALPFAPETKGQPLPDD